MAYSQDMLKLKSILRKNGFGLIIPAILISTSLAVSLAHTAGCKAIYISEQYHNSSPAVSQNEIAAVEQKLLHRVYAGDPMSKRLQRLELLTFGETQYGSLLSRWQNIEKYMQSKNKSGGSISGKSTASSIAELEKYLFKRSNPTLSTSQRLNKLETKLFGQPSTGMSTNDRIARLQKTLGIPNSSGEVAHLPNQMFPPGMGNFGNSPYFMHIEPGFQSFGFGFNSDEMDNDPDPDLSQFESQVNRMFRDMERQMMQPQAPVPHHYQSPKQEPEFSAPHIILPKPHAAPVPPYNDPNFI